MYNAREVIPAEKKYVDGMTWGGRLLKRMFDIVASSVGLLVLSPFFLYILVKLRRKGEGPAIFRQERIGLHGKPFNILKFRTMRPDAEADGVPLLAERWDERLSPDCLFLREHHLDELPQLWNVLVGDMSFVGPRPERQYFIDKIMQENSDYQYLYQVRPGITSLATIYNGYTDTMEKMLIRLQMDLEYLQKRSVWLDAKILFTTIRLIGYGKKI